MTREQSMKKIFITTIFILLIVGNVFASNTATQTIRIVIEPIAVISLGDSGSNQTWLTVNETGIATGSKEVKWTTNQEKLAVYVQSNLTPEQQHNLLQVRATKMDTLNTKGTLNGWVTISDQPSMIITNITREIGGCLLEYQAFAKNAKLEADEHIITFTITKE
jgi:hypothetical protein